MSKGVACGDVDIGDGGFLGGEPPIFSAGEVYGLRGGEEDAGGISVWGRGRHLAGDRRETRGRRVHRKREAGYQDATYSNESYVGLIKSVFSDEKRPQKNAEV